MASPTNYYVDPNAGVDTTGGGAGGSGAPWKTVQYALNHITRDTTNGDQINIKAGTADVLSAALSTATYGTPTTKGFIIRGYTSAANDGGFGDLDGNAGNFSIINATSGAGIFFVDMKLHNTGTAAVVTLNTSSAYCGCIHCEIYDSTGGGIVLNSSSNTFVIHGNYLHDITGNGIANQVGTQFINSLVMYNYFKNGSVRKFTDSVYVGIGLNVVLCNLFSLSGSSNGIHIVRAGNLIMNNSIYGNGSTGSGYYSDDGSNDHTNVVFNNYIQGFSGAGGKGFSTISGARSVLWGGNAAFNNTTNFSLSGDKFVSLSSDTSLTASDFLNASAEDFSVGTMLRGLGVPTSFFGPATTANNYMDTGALQRKELLLPARGRRGDGR